jgi:hypothetical protein
LVGKLIVVTMVRKVFLFDEIRWLYCSDVRLEDGIYSGWVENGAWHLVYDTKTKLLEFYQGSGEKRLDFKPVTYGSAELIWACYPNGIGYNQVIENAKEKYKSGEEANYSLESIKKTRKKTIEDYDEVPF